MHTKGGPLIMPSNNSKYSEETRERTAKFILESRKSATSVAEEMGTDKNTVCCWVRDFRRKNHLSSYAEVKVLKQATRRVDKEINKKLKARGKQIVELEEEEEILKKSLRIFTQPL